MGKSSIAKLGSTGSIGTQALDVIRKHPDLFEVNLLVANNSADLLIEQAREFEPSAVVICNADKYEEVSAGLKDTMVKVFTRMESVCSLVAADDVDIVLAAMVGFSGLRPTLAAIEAGKAIALANKETLVAAGGIVMEKARRKGVPILPVDSEHSAIFQCLQGAGPNRLKKIHLTASGGPFRSWEQERIASAKASDALRHPNWSMGSKITIDSATMMNKGLEVIEAKWLFNVAPDDIHVVVHPQSVIHSMVEFEDGAVLAQLGCPDMRQPILYALAYPMRPELDNKKLDFAGLGSLTFEEPDMGRFPCLGLAFEAISSGGNLPCIANAANEEAVAAYLKDKIAFYDIPRVISACMEKAQFLNHPSLEDIYETNAEVRALAASLIDTWSF
ncbi:MAG: 1-deoxy-D-xylulose-5-phosphate reductoisomerase [Bacteroidales bacterium]|nr:1-deoxy-D-xylulose-5-phosphate reductoisomerase [Bacteroidales bacterium]